MTTYNPSKTIVRLSLLGLLFLGGCASAHNPADPLEPINRSIYSFNDTLDKHIIKPVAKGYAKVMPDAAQSMVANFFANLNDVDVTVNDLLQFKLKQGFSDGMRVFVNTTIGAFGLIDVASVTGLEKHKEDFGLTLAHWGVGNGPYIVIPIFGPSTVRDGAGLYTDLAYMPPQINDVAARNELFIVKGIEKRAGLLNEETILNTATVDPYVFSRDTYLLYRKNLTYGGNPPKINYDED